jgi:hypothetical protein
MESRVINRFAESPEESRWPSGKAKEKSRKEKSLALAAWNGNPLKSGR